jgi:hypothetical protein
MIEQGYHASHRCNLPTCIAPDHIVVESKEANEQRKLCAKAVRTVRVLACVSPDMLHTGTNSRYLDRGRQVHP